MITIAWIAIVWFTSATLICCMGWLRQRRLPLHYHEFCEVWGLCCWWPVTLTLEVLLAFYNRKTR